MWKLDWLQRLHTMCDLLWRLPLEVVPLVILKLPRKQPQRQQQRRPDGVAGGPERGPDRRRCESSIEPAP